MTAKELEGLIAQVASGERSQLIIRDADLDGLSGDDERRIGRIVRDFVDKGCLAWGPRAPASRTIVHR